MHFPTARTAHPVCGGTLIPHSPEPPVSPYSRISAAFRPKYHHFIIKSTLRHIACYIPFSECPTLNTEQGENAGTLPDPVSHPVQSEAAPEQGRIKGFRLLATDCARGAPSPQEYSSCVGPFRVVVSP